MHLLIVSQTIDQTLFHTIRTTLNDELQVEKNVIHSVSWKINTTVDPMRNRNEIWIPKSPCFLNHNTSTSTFLMACKDSIISVKNLTTKDIDVHFTNDSPSSISIPFNYDIFSINNRSLSIRRGFRPWKKPEINLKQVVETTDFDFELPKTTWLDARVFPNSPNTLQLTWGGYGSNSIYFSVLNTTKSCGLTYRQNSTLNFDILVKEVQQFELKSYNHTKPIMRLQEFRDDEMTQNEPSQINWSVYQCTPCSLLKFGDLECNGHGQCYGFLNAQFENRKFPRCQCRLGYGEPKCMTSDYRLLLAIVEGVAFVGIMFCLYICFGKILNDPDNKTYTQEKCFDDERKMINIRRELFKIPNLSKRKKTIGLACSGGGIRSAAFQSGM